MSENQVDKIECPEPNYETVFVRTYSDNTPLFIPLNRIERYIKWSVYSEPVGSRKFVTGLFFKDGWLPGSVDLYSNRILIISTPYEDFKVQWDYLLYLDNPETLGRRLQAFYTRKAKL